MHEKSEIEDAIEITNLLCLFIEGSLNRRFLCWKIHLSIFCMVFCLIWILFVFTVKKEPEYRQIWINRNLR